jgi:hypothetical protein
MMDTENRSQQFEPIEGPTEEEFKFIRIDFKLSDKAMAQLRSTLSEALSHYSAFRRESISPEQRKEVRRKAERASKLMGDLVRLFSENNSQRVMKSFEGRMYWEGLFGPSMIEEAFGEDVASKENEKLRGIRAHELAQMASQTAEADGRQSSRFEQSPLQENSAEMLVFLFKRLRYPFDLWLQFASYGKYGRQPEPLRQILLIYLIRDARGILGEGYTRGNLIKLCSDVSGYYGLADDGIGDACDHILDKHEKDFAWLNLPKLKPIDQEMLESWNADKPDDPEPPLTPAKPGAE